MPHLKIEIGFIFESHWACGDENVGTGYLSGMKKPIHDCEPVMDGRLELAYAVRPEGRFGLL